MSQISFDWPGFSATNPAHRRVREFLVADIQRSPEWARDLADKIEAVMSGKLPHWERTGNAFHLELSPRGASIEDLVDESSPTQTVPLAEFRTAVVTWLQQLQS